MAPELCRNGCNGTRSFLKMVATVPGSIQMPRPVWEVRLGMVEPQAVSGESRPGPSSPVLSFLSREKQQPA